MNINGEAVCIPHQPEEKLNITMKIGNNTLAVIGPVSVVRQALDAFLKATQQ